MRSRGRVTWLRLALIAVCLLSGALGAAPARAAPPPFSPSALHHVRASGISIGYRTIGSGRPLVMIMGFSGTLYVWDPGLLARLAEHRKVIVFDNRGVLTTSRGRGRLTIGLMADDTAALIRALGYRRADVLGWSMGGNIAQELALRHPRRVRRMVLDATDPGGPHALQPTNPRVIRVLNDPNATTNQVLSVIFPQTPVGKAARQAYVQRLLTWPGVTPSDFDASPSITRQQSIAEGQRLWYCAICGAYAHLPSIRARTLVADGRRDIVEPPGNARIISRRIPHARRVLYSQAGHAFAFQHYVTFGARVNRFLG
jgi:pimeloyl-ACP methyl ester carboxylesterase